MLSQNKTFSFLRNISSPWGRRGVLLLLLLSAIAHGQIITTVAGNDTAGFSGDGGPATAAKLHQPRLSRPDGAGNLYIGDVINGRIRKVDTAGVITTVAGGGSSTADGIPATAASLVTGNVLVDVAGNIYLNDEGVGGGRLRKIDTAGIISTFAGGGPGSPGSGDGGPATAAVVGPTDMAMDKAGNMYILDAGENNVRKVDTNGIITTIAGNDTAGFLGDGGPATAAELHQPSGIAVDGQNNIYIADYLNNRVRKVDTGHIITTIAGTGAPGYSGDGGPATAAELHIPYSIAADSAGNVYFADANNTRVRKISGGIITTVAGDSTAGYSGDGGPATAAELGYPVGVSLDAAGNIYITDRQNNNVRKVTIPPPPRDTTDTTAAVPPRLLAQGINIYPNPATTTLTISSNTVILSGAEGQITITNLLGQTMFSNNYNAEKVDVDVAGLPSGVYFIKVNGSEVRKFVKE